MIRWLFALTAISAVIGTSIFADEKPKEEPKVNPFTGEKIGEKSGDKKPADKGDKGKNPFVGEPAEKKDEVVEEAAVTEVAHVKLSGSLSEAPVPEEELFGPPPENLMIKLNRIRKAAKDDKVKALLLEIGSIEGGFGKINEVRQVLREFKATGKKVIAYSESFGTKDYLLALEADQILLPESGGLELYGLRAEVTYYKQTLELLRLQADVLKMGAYKSAVEPFISDKMSAENREQISALLDDNYDNEIVGAIVELRKSQNWKAEDVKKLIDEGPFTAKKAAKLGLVDGLIYDDQIPDSFAKLLKVDEVKITKNYGKPKAQELDFSNPFALLSALGGPKKKRETKEPKIAVIYAIGGISSGKSSVDPLMGGETVGSDTLVEAIRDAEKDDNVKAIVLRVDSPGGSALASDVIWRAIVECKKPVVASMGDVAASGGYYISMGAKKIYAEPGTITGSIGVFGLKLVTGGLEEWAGMKTEVVSRGKNSGVNSSTFPWTESEREAMTSTVEEVYDMFLNKAVKGRNAAGVKLSREELEKLAGGRVWTGRQAKANGLVDELGTLKDAINSAKEMAGIDPKEEMKLLILPKAQNFFDKLLEGDSDFPFFGTKASILRSIPGADRAVKNLAPLLQTQKDPVKAFLPFQLQWK